MIKRLSVRIPRRHWAAAVSCLFFAVSAALRLGYYLTRETDGFTLAVQLIMPVTAAAVFLAGMAAGGKWAKPAVMGATVLGVVFFLIKATAFTPVHQALCTVLYLGVLVLFCGTLLGLLPTKKGRKYYECDIDFDGTYRNAKRIVFSNDGLIYYTEDHYESFELLYGEET